MPEMAATLATNLIVLLGLMSLLWLVSLILRDVSIVDPFWGAGFVVVAWITVPRLDDASARVMLIAVLTTLWGTRLSLFLLIRNWGHAEDKRYAAMRAKHGPKFRWLSLFTVFWLQALILWFVAMPIQVAAMVNSPRPITAVDALGVLIWALGLFFETVGDAQLARFKRRPENSGKVMDRGLWGWTRHPNYFGDFCIWWGIFVVAAMGGAGWTLASPLVMSWLLMKVSGVTLLEKSIADRRPDYAEYKRRTPAFFPRPPKARQSG